jgi:hypothetical protein
MIYGHKKYGFLKFSAFSKIISPEARTIGIITQPFEGQSRRVDNKPQGTERCKIVVHALMEYLQDKFPNARISLRNDPSENIALSYARMIMANQTIAGVSSFPLIPTMATFGYGYIRKPTGIFEWLTTPPVDQMADNIFLMDEPELLTSLRLVKLWNDDVDGEAKILEWFKNDKVSLLEREVQ